jgi:hypothetical protein
MIAGFLIGKTAFYGIGNSIGIKSDFFYKNIDRRIFVLLFVGSMLAINFLHLLFPVSNLHLILSPPEPNISLWFDARFDQQPSFIEQILRYFKLLITPFFYISLYFLRKKTSALFIILAITRYLEYVDASYIARGTIVSDFILIYIVMWKENIRWRAPLLAFSLFLFPFFLYQLGQYSVIRMGGNIDSANIFDGALNVLWEETSFLSERGVLVIDSGERVDLWRYLSWLVTLPLPGFMKQGVPVSLINYEISSILIGKEPTDRGFYVALSGLLSESYYIYGQCFFGIHGMFCGFLAAFFSRIFERVPEYSILALYVAVYFFHDLNRGGVAAILPLAANGFMAFYVVHFFMRSPPNGRSLKSRVRKMAEP